MYPITEKIEANILAKISRLRDDSRADNSCKDGLESLFAVKTYRLSTS